MIIDKFSQRIVSSNLINTYVATSFFATVIFFVVNANIYTPLEMITGVILVTITFKGISNMMFSLVVLLVNLDNNNKSLEFEKTTSKVNSLLNELQLQKTKLKANQATKG
jgi:hypothetical protein